MKAKYDSETDTLRIRFRDARIEESDEHKPGLILDYDANGQLVALEMLDASRRTDDPFAFEYAVAQSHGENSSGLGQAAGRSA